MGAAHTLLDMASDNFIEDFISSQVTGRGLDSRTEQAYRMDLKLFYGWLAGQEDDKETPSGNDRTDRLGNQELDIRGNGPDQPELEEGLDIWKKQMETYLIYLSREKKLRTSTISRKARVFRYYVSYLAAEGILTEDQNADRIRFSAAKDIEAEAATLSKQEVDALFQSMAHEYVNLDSDFRRRVCLRDQVMLKLLFYHGIEISELLILETTDYDRKKGTLTIRGKRGKQRTIPIFSAALRHQLGQWLDEHDYFQREEQYTSRMFLSKLGKPLSMKMVILIFDKYRVMAGIEKECTPKSLKSSMQRYGAELVMEWCG